jgi:hypothetical protein
VEGSSAKVSAESDTTVNRFFNNPPSADPEQVISHSIIHKFKNPEPVVAVPVPLSPVKESLNNSENRFDFNAATDQEKSDDEEIELRETDVSEVNEIDDEQN